ncbi:uncharacterized protein EDB91DRAFT_1087538 [Suillus paluster]|uniref:uncharacterized protein n=1 Tax=Suillus paluster TaxID=48578 RepID=UPI001B864DFF|nr:uncharacterized protein EDB91DRAFT_1087538 [Suillus paluster]KAG1724237.1 hypothetical protein EDB91DRAFT_1087538 [Suillus paluster]
MTTEFKEAKVTNLVVGDTWGLCITEAFRMVRHGMDVPDVTLVIQCSTTVDIPHPEEGDGTQATSSGSVENTPIVTDAQLRELMRPASTSERVSRQKKEKELD